MYSITWPSTKWGVTGHHLSQHLWGKRFVLRTVCTCPGYIMMWFSLPGGCGGVNIGNVFKAQIDGVLRKGHRWYVDNKHSVFLIIQLSRTMNILNCERHPVFSHFTSIKLPQQLKKLNLHKSKKSASVYCVFAAQLMWVIFFLSLAPLLLFSMTLRQPF